MTINHRKLIRQFVEMTDEELLTREAELWEELKRATINQEDDKQADAYHELNIIREFAQVKRMIRVPKRYIDEAEIKNE